MPDPVDPKAFLTLVELAIGNMYELEAIEKHGVGHIKDVDTDGDDDVVCHFPTQDSGLQCGNTTATLMGTTLGGQSIMGSDSIVTQGCK